MPFSSWRLESPDQPTLLISYSLLDHYRSDLWTPPFARTQKTTAQQLHLLHGRGNRPVRHEAREINRRHDGPKRVQPWRNRDGKTSTAAGKEAAESTQLVGPRGETKGMDMCPGLLDMCPGRDGLEFMLQRC